jgi:hypothetical protein
MADFKTSANREVMACRGKTSFRRSGEELGVGTSSQQAEIHVVTILAMVRFHAIGLSEAKEIATFILFLSV